MLNQPEAPDGTKRQADALRELIEVAETVIRNEFGFRSKVGDLARSALTKLTGKEYKF